MNKLLVARVLLSWFMGMAIALICYSLGMSWIWAEVISTIIGFGFGFILKYVLS